MTRSVVSGLSVLTKRGLFSSYSSSVTKVVNVLRAFLTLGIVSLKDPLASCKITKSIGFLGRCQLISSVVSILRLHPLCVIFVLFPTSVVSIPSAEAVLPNNILANPNGIDMNKIMNKMETFLMKSFMLFSEILLRFLPPFFYSRYINLVVLATLSRSFQQWYDLLIHSLPVAVLLQDTYLV